MNRLPPFTIICCSLLVWILPTSFVHAAPGQLDLTFGSGGRVYVKTAGGQRHVGNQVKVQSDGKILVAGNLEANTDGILLRFLPTGALDPSFGTSGISLLHFASANCKFHGMEVQPDGKIVVAGIYNSGSTTVLLLARYDTAGNLDSAFGTNGVLITLLLIPFDSWKVRLAVQNDSKIVVCWATSLTGSGDFNIARFNSNGTVDNTFGTSGRVVIDVGGQNDADWPMGMVLQSDQKIVVVGYSRFSNTGAGGTSVGHQAVVRLTSTGALDSAFGISGKVILSIPAASQSCITLDPIGRILVGGSTASTSMNQIVVTRMQADGSLDTTFGVSGTATTTLSPNAKLAADLAAGIVTQADGKPIVGCYCGILGDVYSSVVPAVVGVWAVARFQTDGTLDTTFGTNGRTITDMGGSNESITDICLQSNGAIVGCGDAAPTVPASYIPRLAVARWEGSAVSVPTALENWRQTYFGSTSNTGNAADTSDPDGDGIQNLAEFAFGLNPNQGSSNQLPVAQLSGGNFVYDFSQPSGVTGVTYGAQWSSTLLPGSWTSIPDTGSGGHHVFSVATNGETKLFVRLVVSL